MPPFCKAESTASSGVQHAENVALTPDQAMLLPCLGGKGRHMNKRYRKVLQPRNIILDLHATDKPGVIAELVDHLVSTGDIAPQKRDEVLAAVLSREKRMSTGLQHGVAVPHGKTDAVSDLIAVLGRSRHGAEFASLDGRPAQIFVLILSPESMAGPHVEFLAEISRLLTRAEIRERLLAAESAEEILNLFDQSADR